MRKYSAPQTHTVRLAASTLLAASDKLNINSRYNANPALSKENDGDDELWED